jgi:pimeloyl-ACP methyl ester carboxylesterase
VRRIDVGGYKLAIECHGRGRPTVVLDSGFSTGRKAWKKVVPKVSTTTRVCAYDRAGLGGSERRPSRIPPTTATIVDELHKLLANGHETPPYVLAGWSMGGFDVRYFQRRYPGDVAGIVLVDGTPARWILDLFDGRLDSGEETMIVTAGAHALEPPPALGALPLVDLSHGIPLTPGEVPRLADPERTWVAEQKQVTRSSTNALLVRADHSTHDIPMDDPALVAGALRLEVTDIRRSARLGPCAASGLEQYDATCVDAGRPAG